jgi:small subunit ribosomal protein S19e
MASPQSHTVKDVPADDFIQAYAEYLKKNKKLIVPKWSDFVKTGKGKEIAPMNPDWLYIRCAAVARKVYLRGHLGVGTMQHIYGAK